MNLFRKLKTLLRQPLFIVLWLAPAWALLAASRALVLSLPFKHIVNRLGASNGTSPAIPLLNPTQEQQALYISRTIRLAAKYAPWNANCFAQAITARLLLGLYKIPYGLYFGIASRGDISQMAAHAWVAAGRVPVTGGHSFSKFIVVGCFMEKLEK